jgi:hypothetical protein
MHLEHAGNQVLKTTDSSKQQQAVQHGADSVTIRSLLMLADWRLVPRSMPGVGASPEDEARVELQRSLRAWLDLQSSVNALIDSTTAPEKGITVGLLPRVRV